MKKLIPIIFILGSLVGCGNSCDDNPQCVYESCLIVKKQMQDQGREIGNTMQCTQPPR